MTIKLLACDLDGTLADHEGFISDVAVAALSRARAEGIQTVIATGRIYTVISPFLDRVGITVEPVISAQGALVTYRDGQILRRLTLDTAVARQATTIAHDFDASMAYFSEKGIMVDSYKTSPEQYQAWFGGDARLVADPLSLLDHNFIKFMAIHDDTAVVPRLLQALREGLDGHADITRSWHWFVEGTTPGADKGAALAWLCERRGIKRDEVLAIGDAGNDVTMLQWAGHSAAPESGDPNAHAAAGWIAPPISEEPVAATLQYFLGW